VRVIFTSIIVYIMLGLQLGLGPFVAYRGVTPNLVLLVVVFSALNLPRDAALLTCFFIGLIQDAVSVQPLGLYAFGYGLVAIVVCWLAESVRRAHPLTHLSLAFMAAMIVGMLLLVHELIRPVSPTVHIGPRVVAISAAYTTILAPFVIGILQQLSRLTGWSSGQRRWDRV
jgi:rod shape-determining protein MreD